MLTLYLACIPEDVRRAQGFGLPLAHMAYRLGSRMTLIRGSIGASSKGGLMVLSDEGSDRSDGNIEALCDEIIRECISREYGGLVLDFELEPRRQIQQLASMLSERLTKRGLTLYVHESCAAYGGTAVVIVQAAVTSGSFQALLEQYKRKYAGMRLALELERMARDIELPSAGGDGSRLSRAELQALLSGRENSTFFSTELQARYFTRKDSQGYTHFMVYDDKQSIGKKLYVAEQLGYSCAFALYGDMEDILA